MIYEMTITSEDGKYPTELHAGNIVYPYEMLI